MPLRSARDGVFSYSSIAPAADGGAEDADEAPRVSFGGVWTRGNDDAWACDEGGADGEMCIRDRHGITPGRANHGCAKRLFFVP